MLRFHGSRDKKTFELIGYNSRLDELQAAALRVFLPQAATRWNRARREAAARYAELGLGDARRACRSTSPGTSTTCSSCRSPERDRIAEALTDGRDLAAPLLRARRSTSSRRSATSATGGRSLPETERAAAEGEGHKRPVL